MITLILRISVLSDTTFMHTPSSRHITQIKMKQFSCNNKLNYLAERITLDSCCVNEPSVNNNCMLDHALWLLIHKGPSSSRFASATMNDVYASVYKHEPGTEGRARAGRGEHKAALYSTFSWAPRAQV